MLNEKEWVEELYKFRCEPDKLNLLIMKRRQELNEPPISMKFPYSEEMKYKAAHIIKKKGSCAFITCSCCPCGKQYSHITRMYGCGSSDSPIDRIARVDVCKKALADMVKE